MRLTRRRKCVRSGLEWLQSPRCICDDTEVAREGRTDV